MDNQESAEVPKELVSTLAMLNCAYSDGFASNDYLPLLFALKQGMSVRQEAKAIGIFLGRDYMNILNDVYYVASESYSPDVEALEIVKQCLLHCGYEKWLKED